MLSLGQQRSSLPWGLRTPYFWYYALKSGPLIIGVRHAIVLLANMPHGMAAPGSQ